MRRAVVIGAGPNGMSAAAAMARSGVAVEVLEASATIGGGARTEELTLPGFWHDVGSSVYPMGVASLIFRSLGLERYGLRWIQPESPLAHPLEGGGAVMLEHSAAATARGLGEDRAAWVELFEPLAERWEELVPELLGPVIHFPRSPLLMARFGAAAAMPATLLARTMFRGERARALFCGMAAHSVRPLEDPLSAAVGMVLGIGGQAPGGGWPVVEGGARRLTEALAACVKDHGGELRTGARVERIEQLPDGRLRVLGDGIDTTADVVLGDVTPRALVSMAGGTMQGGSRRLMERYQYGPGTFKVDWALSEPIPWAAPECGRAGTVHLAGTMEEMAASERAPWEGRVEERPFVLLTQPSVCDPTRAPEGKHTAWGYCHVPNGWTGDALARIEAQVERFAPGFRDCVLERRMWSCAAFEEWNANLIGGDLSGGAMTALQTVMRPTPRLYETSIEGVYLCSSSTPPGGGVHGMCGFHAAERALGFLRKRPTWRGTRSGTES